MCVCVSCSIVSDSETPWTVAHLVICLREFPGKNIRVGCHSFLHGIFLTQGSNQGLQCCRQISYHLRHQGSPSDMYIIIDNKQL